MAKKVTAISQARRLLTPEVVDPEPSSPAAGDNAVALFAAVSPVIPKTPMPSAELISNLVSFGPAIVRNMSEHCHRLGMAMASDGTYYDLARATNSDSWLLSVVKSANQFDPRLSIEKNRTVMGCMQAMTEQFGQYPCRIGLNVIANFGLAIHISIQDRRDGKVYHPQPFFVPATPQTPKRLMVKLPVGQPGNWSEQELTTNHPNAAGLIQELRELAYKAYSGERAGRDVQKEEKRQLFEARSEMKTLHDIVEARQGFGLSDVPKQPKNGGGEHPAILILWELLSGRLYLRGCDNQNIESTLRGTWIPVSIVGTEKVHLDERNPQRRASQMFLYRLANQAWRTEEADTLR